MNTNNYFPALYAITLSCTIWAVFFYRTQNKKITTRWHIPYLTISSALLLTIFAFLQSQYPPLVHLLERSTMQIMSGQWWRLFTSLLVQDGGTSGTIFNILSLLACGTFAEQFWKRRQWIVIFILGGIIANYIALFWQPIGAGNSIANFSIIGSLIIFSYIKGKHLLIKILDSIAFFCTVILLMSQNIHGAAIMIGIFFGLLFTKYSQHRTL